MNKITFSFLLWMLPFMGGCAGQMPSLNVGTSVTLNTMLGIESAYGIALSGERSYKELCRSKVIPSDCRVVVVRLQQADAKAIQSIKSANNFIKSYPTIDASNVIGAARSAVSDLQAILNTTGAK